MINQICHCDKSDLDVVHDIIHELCSANKTFALCFQGLMLGMARVRALLSRGQDFPKQTAFVLVLLLWYGKIDDLDWVHKVTEKLERCSNCWGQRTEPQLVHDAVSCLISGSSVRGFSQSGTGYFSCRLLPEARWKWFLYWQRLSRNNWTSKLVT